MDVLLWIGHLQEEQLRDDRIGDHVIHRGAEEDDPVHQEAGINVIGAFAPAGLFHYVRNKILHIEPVFDLIGATYITNDKASSVATSISPLGRTPSAGVFRSSAAAPCLKIADISRLRTCEHF